MLVIGERDTYMGCQSRYIVYIPYFLDWNARVLLVSSGLLAGVVFEGAFYSRARSIQGRGLFLSASQLLNFSANIITLSLKVLS